MSSSKLTAALRDRIIADFCTALKDQYVYPDLGDVIGDFLNKKLRDGEYGSFETSESFATRLTEDVQEVGFCLIQFVSIANEPRLVETYT